MKKCKGDKMKRYFPLIGILMLCLFGCSEDPLQQNDPTSLDTLGLYGAPLDAE